ncbi:hypothetical protein [Thermoproteus tenax]|uniref:PaREP7 family protein n=1 Tax=Thermoproteus tenax (strain ATCC 35583 / DSM 2078 / JCM 9277 / NBRC 100435 / Kra 1) TaxID=768679 RepID=G4RN75_THETK|nr:hypothetical protein [Thermoproteus tenax]CCC81019.1 paREP7 family protein [Thermoproteus tenax Kra 1]
MSIDRDALKRLTLDLLRSDEEFRLAVAGLIGLGAVLEELRKLREDFNRFAKDQAERWAENNRRWEENNKRWEENNRRWEEEARRWAEEMKRWEENNRRWEENNRRWEENSKRWEENNKRWEENNKRWEEAYRRFEAIELELKKLREDFNRFVEIEEKRWEEAENKFRWLMEALDDIRRALGGGFEYYTARVVGLLLRERGVECDVRVNVTLPIDGFKEVDLICYDPLVVGEVTVAVRSIEEAEREVGKLLEAERAVERFTGRKTYMRVLAVEFASEDVAEYLRRKAQEMGILLLLGREYERL